MKKDLVNLHHARSRQDFPELKLEDDEFVELALRRTRIGIILIWSGAVIGSLLLVLVLAIFGVSNTMSADTEQYLGFLLLALLGVMLVIALVATKVYNGNSIYITNRRVIQLEMTSLFAQSKNVIDLVSIEDVSFKQTGVMQYLFHYGTLRMATVGDETTYTFTYLDKPTDEMDVITHLLHVAKEKQNKKD